MTETFRNRRFQYLIALVIVVLVLGAILQWHPIESGQTSKPAFDGQRAYSDVIAQMGFGPRVTGTAGNRMAGDYIAAQLVQAGWAVEFQNFTYRGTQIRNVIGRANLGNGPVIVIGAHYDTRRWADQDPTYPRDPVPGANDGASGVAVLLELARVLNLRQVHHEIWLAFFDAEDDGGIDGWDWCVGSSYMASNLSIQPHAMILIDMVGDADQQIYFEHNSDHTLRERVWAIAAKLGYGDHFIAREKWTLIDDHIPFLQRGIPSIDIIDFDYPYWHTVADTADKISPTSLERVGQTLQAFLETAE